jgi:hypothetical protein
MTGYGPFQVVRALGSVYWEVQDQRYPFLHSPGTTISQHTSYQAAQSKAGKLYAALRKHGDGARKH